MADAPFSRSSLDRIGALVRSGSPPENAEHRLEGRARLTQAVGRMWDRQRSTRRLTLAASALAMALGAAALVLAYAARRSPIAWRMERGEVGAEGYVSASA